MPLMKKKDYLWKKIVQTSSKEGIKKYLRRVNHHFKSNNNSSTMRSQVLNNLAKHHN